jgi:superfamily II DNA helicase RecQ
MFAPRSITAAPGKTALMDRWTRMFPATTETRMVSEPGIRSDGVGIIYAESIKHVEAAHTELTAIGLSVAMYHGRLGPRERHNNQERFMAGDLKATVATNAFGMRIDKADIRYVIHYSMPGSLEA